VNKPAALGPHLATNRRRLVTPEGVDLSLRLATGGQRVWAFLLDLMIMVIAMIALSALALGIVIQSGGAVQSVAAAIWMLRLLPDPERLLHLHGRRPPRGDPWASARPACGWWRAAASASPSKA
jgi:hypothetical protein